MIKKLLIVILIITISVTGYYYKSYQALILGFKSNDRVPIIIEHGTAAKKIVQKLESKKIIDHSWPMLIYLRLNEEKKANLQAGNYILTRGTPITELVEILSNGQNNEIPIRILEGQTIVDIDSKLAKNKLIKPGEYIECAKKQDNKQTKEILAYILVNSLKLLHPFMPFVTETIYQTLPFKKEKFLMIENWPK